MKEALEGKIDKLIYQNDQTGYCVFQFDCPDGKITAAGTLYGPVPGGRCRLEGEFRTHPKYGEQFAFSTFSELEPDSADAMISFLSSGVIKGIGIKVAEAIVSAFGEKTAEIIANSPERLTEVRGVGKKTAEKIAEGYREHRGYASLVMALAPFGISTSVCTRLFKAYGTDAERIVTEDPFRLTEEVDGFGFARADEIASKLGIPADDKRRVRCGVLYALSLTEENGSTYANEPEFIESLSERLGVTRDDIADAIFELVMDGMLVEEKLGGSQILMHWYLYELEQQAARSLFELAHSPLSYVSGNAENLISASERSSGITLSEKQRNAVVSSIRNGVSVITGGPGTGKTTIIKMLLAVLEGSGVKTMLAAPTGRAAKRMSQATGRKAKTIHRLLEAQYSDEEGKMYFLRGEDNPLECGCVIIDEVSMVDIILMTALLSAIKPGTRLILVGDADQLPSVGPGSVLKDVIESETIHCVKLTEIFRQAQESTIVTNAHAINKGEYPACNSRGGDFFFMENPDPRSCLELIKDLCSRRLPAFYKDIDPFFDIQVLTPSKKDVLGSKNLNAELQFVLNPPAPEKPEITFGAKTFRLGDKVIQTKNDYSLDAVSMKGGGTNTGVYNGDIGVVFGVDNESGKMTVLFDDEWLVIYDFTNAEELDMAYALTVHKSQGSEFRVVVMPVSTFLPMLTTRNLLYTAITRAKDAVVLVGRPRLLFSMVDNNSVSSRNSGLGIRLRKLWDFEYEGF